MAGITESVNQGKTNVIIWTNFSFVGDRVKSSGFTANQISATMTGLANLHQADRVLHFVRVGGFGNPHGISDCTECSGVYYARAFRRWNDDMKKAVEGFPGFAGIDWSYQGGASSQFSTQTAELVLNVSGELVDEFIMMMSPPQSYFDCASGNFSRSLNLPALTASSWRHHGRNVYAAMYAKCPNCFDIVAVDVSERHSRAGYDLYWHGDSGNVGKEGWPVNATGYAMRTLIKKHVQCVTSGWDVKVKGFLGLNDSVKVVVPHEKLMIGLELINDEAAHEYTYLNAGDAGQGLCSLSYNQRGRGFVLKGMDLDTRQMYVKELSQSMQCATSVQEFV